MSFKAHFLDVGQGDTSFVELPNGQFMLIDCNQREDVLDILKYIKGIIPIKDNKYLIDYLVLTHPHKDHIRGLKNVVCDEEISIGEIWESGHRTRDDDEEYKKYVELMNRDDLNVIKVKAAPIPFREFDDIKIYIFAPSKYVTEDEKDDSRKAIHSRCMVMKIEYNDKSILFTGDSSFDCWKERIVPNYSDDSKNLGENLLKSDVLSVAHHGSRTFFMEKKGDKPYKRGIKKISPSVCVVSVGKDNEHGHPHREAMRIYGRESDDRYVTKNEGTFIIDMDDFDVQFVGNNNESCSSDDPIIEVFYLEKQDGEKDKKVYDSRQDKQTTVKKGGWLRFELVSPNYDYNYKWVVRNYGRAVWIDYLKSFNKSHLRNENEGNFAERELRWKGTHKMTCHVVDKDRQETISKKVIRVRITE